MAETAAPDLETSVDFNAEYCAKDLILYALALGFGSSPEKRHEELRYLYERHPDFCAVPTFCLVLTFWASHHGTGTSHDIPPFPPFLMSSMGVIPRKLLREDLSSALPVLHIYQSIKWFRPLPIPLASTDNASSAHDHPVATTLRGRFVSVTPKKVGTFVTTETDVLLRSALICTLQSTALVMGIAPENVISYQSGGKLNSQHQKQMRMNRNHDFEWTYTTTPSQALLYRIASGDSNSIHVDPSTARLVGGDGTSPILHGLCTLGIATRALIQYLAREGGEVFIRQLAGRFTKPVFVGDKLRVRIWEQERLGQSEMRLLFTVHNVKTNDIVVDQGRAAIRLHSKRQSQERVSLSLVSNL